MLGYPNITVFFKFRGKIIRKLVYADTLIQFRDKDAKMINRAFEIGKRIK